MCVYEKDRERQRDKERKCVSKCLMIMEIMILGNGGDKGGGERGRSRSDGNVATM